MRKSRRFTVEISEGDGNYYVAITSDTGFVPLTISIVPEAANAETESLDRIICGAMVAALRYNR